MAASRPEPEPSAPGIPEEGPDSDPDDFSMDDMTPDYRVADLPMEEEMVAGNAPEDTPLLSLDEAVGRIPEELRQRMEDLLRAEFREVLRWTPPKA